VPIRFYYQPREASSIRFFGPIPFPSGCRERQVPPQGSVEKDLPFAGIVIAVGFPAIIL